jgi:hypothetical protein
MSSELEKFQRDLLESVKQMKRGQTARVTKVRNYACSRGTFEGWVVATRFCYPVRNFSAHAAGLGARPERAYRSGQDPVTCRLLPPGGATRAPALKRVRPGRRLPLTFVADECIRRSVGMLDPPLPDAAWRLSPDGAGGLQLASQAQRQKADRETAVCEKACPRFLGLW